MIGARLMTGGRPRAVVLAGLIAVTLVVAACGSASSGGGVSPGKATDTATWAEPANSPPNWILPFDPGQYLTVINGQLQGLLFRGLYAFGGGTSGGVGINESLSLAQLPSWNAAGTQVTITLKNYKWSNGESVNADDVMFWLHLDQAEKLNNGDYSPGELPDNVTSITSPNPSTVVITTNKPYSQNWFLYAQLAQITPFPAAWDVTGPGKPSHCDTTVSDCAAVWNYLQSQAKAESTYATSPLWSVVDGPWKLKSFSSDGHISVVPNTKYSGPQKPTLKQFNMAPFTSDSAEFNVLHGGKTIDVGYIPTQDISQPKPAGSGALGAGPNPISGYTLLPQPGYGIQFIVLNYTNTAGQVGIINQLYFRQALQSVVNQPALIKAAAKGYGVPGYGPVPLYPINPAAPLSSAEKNNPYPFSISAAKKYLTDNGWKIVPNGTDTCVKPGTGTGECGAGITAGEKLSLSLVYSSGTQSFTTTMESVKSNASQAGINISLRGVSFDQVVQIANPCSGSGPTCTWSLADWGGWLYGGIPTGESLFKTGAINSGGYANPTMDKLIDATLTSNSKSAFTDYENFAAKNLPVIYLPEYTSSLTEVGNGLKGVTKSNPLSVLQPEYWHY